MTVTDASASVFDRPGAGLSVLCGRRAECAQLDSMLDAVRRGRSRSLVLLGEAGIGKTALLDYLSASASDATVIRAAGVESEMELPYASLHQLCGPELDSAVGLPDPQREALEIVFGLNCGAPPDGLLVGLAVLGLFSEVAEAKGPLLCIVDDAHWLDRASALTLAFVARRLRAERIGIAFAARDPGDELTHLPSLDVPGIGNADARGLLDSAVRFKLDARVRERILAEARGNPLALVELPRGLTTMEVTGSLARMETPGLSQGIEASFVRRLDALPEDTRRLLLVAAAEPMGDPLLFWNAVAYLGIGQCAARAAEADDLVSINERVAFRHPLVRSAVYRSSGAEDRRAAHLALARVTDGDADPDRRAWHLAEAAAGPDEGVARELELSAGRAQARGGLAAGAAFLQRAVAMTADPDRRADRALAAAEASLHAGTFECTAGLLATAESGKLAEVEQTKVDLLRAQLAFAVNRGSDAPPLLLKAAQQLTPLDPELARETYLEAVFAALFAGRRGKKGGVVEVARAALEAPPASVPPRAADLLLDGYALAIAEGYAVGAPVLQRAVNAFRSKDIDPGEVLRWAFLASYAAQALLDENSYRELPARQVELAREAGALSVLPMSLTFRMGSLLRAGDLDAVHALLGELDQVTELTGTTIPPYAAVALAAWRGREAEARGLMEITMDDVVARGEGCGETFVEWTTAVLYNGLGRYDEALAAARAAYEHPEELQSPLWLHELIEAAVRCGEGAIAAGALEELATIARITGTDWALGLEARSRAQLSDGEAAETLYLEAVERLERSAARVELARAHLLYGEWLRREGRRCDARAHLQTAYEQLAAIGAEAFAQRAARELRATGAKARRRNAETRDDMTAQERQIAELARDGLSNPEIGARLFLSPRTVEWHLRKVYSKLGIRSRRELVTASLGSGAEPVPA